MRKMIPIECGACDGEGTDEDGDKCCVCEGRGLKWVPKPRVGDVVTSFLRGEKIGVVIECEPHRIRVNYGGIEGWTVYYGLADVEVVSGEGLPVTMTEAEKVDARLIELEKRIETKIAGLKDRIDYRYGDPAPDRTGDVIPTSLEERMAALEKEVADEWPAIDRLRKRIEKEVAALRKSFVLEANKIVALEDKTRLVNQARVSSVSALSKRVVALEKQHEVSKQCPK